MCRVWAVWSLAEAAVRISRAVVWSCGWAPPVVSPWACYSHTCASSSRESTSSQSPTSVRTVNRLPTRHELQHVATPVSSTVAHQFSESQFSPVLEFLARPLSPCGDGSPGPDGWLTISKQRHSRLGPLILHCSRSRADLGTISTATPVCDDERSRHDRSRHLAAASPADFIGYSW